MQLLFLFRGIIALITLLLLLVDVSPKEKRRDPLDRLRKHRQHTSRRSKGTKAKTSDNAVTKQNNLVFIVFDDLRPDLSIYGRNYMVTPNFERLAARSVVFDHAYCQVAVCNPSRNSLLTGLRPDSTGSYNFDRPFYPFMPFPAQLVRSGYNTASIGKISHWAESDAKIWNFDSWNNDWYGYQSKEGKRMNSTVMPDATIDETQFRDYEFTSRAITTLRKMVSSSHRYFMLGLGFKLPHLAMHVPYKYFSLYNNDSLQQQWSLSKKELRFPSSAPEVSYRCCSETHFRYMRDEGRDSSINSIRLGNINQAIPKRMHNELMMGYSAAISYLDAQLGRLLDVLDELDLWQNTTVVLTSDHGMHNGEKGIWEKWSLFDESTRVPLMIAHPLSPYRGQHYSSPVELIDIYPTLNELLRLPVKRTATCSGWQCRKLDGKSLARVVLGDEVYNTHYSGIVGGGALHWLSNRIKQRANSMLRLSVMAPADATTNITTTTTTTTEIGHTGGAVGTGGHVVVDAATATAATATVVLKDPMPALEQSFAISQVLRCADRKRLPDSLRSWMQQQQQQQEQQQQEQPTPTLSTTTNQSLLMKGQNPPAVRKRSTSNYWTDCEMNMKLKSKRLEAMRQVCILGYSVRTLEYRYTAYFHFNRTSMRPILNFNTRSPRTGVGVAAVGGAAGGRNEGRAGNDIDYPIKESHILPYEEELYDHKNESLTHFTHRELQNLAYKPLYNTLVAKMRASLIRFIKSQFRIKL